MQFFSVNTFKIGIAATIVSALVGCSGTAAIISDRDLNVQTQMSNSIFLQPVSPNERTVYIQVSNTSGHAELNNLLGQLITDFNQKGYMVKDDPKNAHYIVQANILQGGEVDPDTAKKLLEGGFGGAALGGAVGALSSDHPQLDSTGTVAGALIGAAAGAAFNAAFKNVTYTFTTDVQISEYTKNANTQTANLGTKQGDSGSISTVSTQSTHWQRYQIRLVSSANKLNLDFPEAAPALVASMASTITGLF